MNVEVWIAVSCSFALAVALLVSLACLVRGVPPAAQAPRRDVSLESQVVVGRPTPLTVKFQTADLALLKDHSEKYHWNISFHQLDLQFDLADPVLHSQALAYGIWSYAR